MPGHSRRITALPAALAVLLSCAAPAAAAAGPALVNRPLIRVGGDHPLTDPHGHVLNSTSSNWAGYVATGRTYTSVSSSWTQPRVSCSGNDTYSSFWVGLDGDGSNSVEQTGTEADCSGGRAYYSSWYEMYPAYPVNYYDTVEPGDSFTATVSTDGYGDFTLTLTNRTRGWTETQSKYSGSAQLASAEVIAEAPSSSSGVLPLSDFGTAYFSGAKANGQAIGNFGPDRLTMASGSTTKAATSSLSGGENFSVTWKHE